MIRAQRNLFRDYTDLSGVWRIRFDPDEIGEAENWRCGLGPDTLAIAVPGSWNEQLSETGYMNYVGSAWLETEVFVPLAWAGKRLTLRFGSADYFATVWIEGRLVGRSGAAMLPFELDVTALVRPGETARMSVRVSNMLPIDGPTQRVEQADYLAEGRPRDEYLPAVRFDFFPYGGLNRPVHLTCAPQARIADVRATPRLDGDAGVLGLEVHIKGGGRWTARIAGHGAEASGDGELRVERVRPWGPDDPALYELTVELLGEDGAVVDSVTERIGFREVRVEADRLLLNGRPVQLRGFGKHEDSVVRGRGLDLPLLVKDFGLLRWTGANSVRTSHYPYSEEFLDFADEAGVLVIDEVFSINLDFRRVTDATLAAHKQAVAELIARDRNRACVIGWSLANEPGYLAEPEYRERSGPYWRDLFAHARSLDATRPMTHANVAYAGLEDPAFAESDICTINRYHGWYGNPGQLDVAAARLKADLDHLSATFGKPVFVAEFGADAIAGFHATTDQLWTEDYQADFLETYWRVIDAHPGCMGGHVWAFADFRTAQHARRAVLNHKGVFTRTRDPKRAAFRLRELWGGR